MRGVRRPAATVAVRPLAAPTPLLPVKVPVHHAGQSERFPGARLVARLRRLEATRAPAVGAEEARRAGGSGPSASRRRRPRRSARSRVAGGDGADDSPADSR